MEQLFYATAIYSAFAATTFLILTKYKIIVYLQARTKSSLNKLLNCVLCISFWLCLIFTLIGLIFGADIITLLCPFAGGAITRAIIN